MLIAFALALSRVSGMFLTAPFFSRGSVPRRARVLLALGITATLLPTLQLSSVPRDAVNLVGCMIGEIAVGMAIGLLARLLITSFQLAGEIIAFQMGFSLAISFDPDSESSEPVIASIHLSLVTLLFLLLDGHHLLVRSLAASFEPFPLGGALELESLARGLLAAAGDMFEVGMRAAAPVAGLLLLLNAMIGFVNRITPQLSIFNVGFPLTVMGGLLGILLSLPRLASFFADLCVQLESRSAALLGG